MSEPFLGEVRMVGFNFAPRSWAFCDGQILPINQNQSLYSLLGTTYGGDGRTSFALPDLRGRTPIHKGEGHNIGQKAGAETVSLTQAEMPAHKHGAVATTDIATQRAPNSERLLGTISAAGKLYGDSVSSNEVPLMTGTISNTGSGVAHPNMQPYLTISYCIALQGIFPSRN